MQGEACDYAPCAVPQPTPPFYPIKNSLALFNNIGESHELLLGLPMQDVNLLIGRCRIGGALVGLLSLCAGLCVVGQAHAGGEILTTKGDCVRPTRHVPAPDVAYQPGVDVNGKPVVPADLGGTTMFMSPDAFDIDIDINLSDRFAIPGDPTFYDPNATVGTLSVRSLGEQPRLEFNGQPQPTTPELHTGLGCAD